MVCPRVVCSSKDSNDENSWGKSSSVTWFLQFSSHNNSVSQLYSLLSVLLETNTMENKTKTKPLLDMDNRERENLQKISYGLLTACFRDIFENRNYIYTAKNAWNQGCAELQTLSVSTAKLGQLWPLGPGSGPLWLAA